MRLMIDIPEEDYIRIKHDCGKSVDNDPETFIKYPHMKRSDFYPVYLIGNGTPVPEKGEWIAKDSSHGYVHYHCSECDGYVTSPLDCSDFCPHCGTAMRKE